MGNVVLNCSSLLKYSNLKNTLFNTRISILNCT